jgi:hypothetical protein
MTEVNALMEFWEYRRLNGSDPGSSVLPSTTQNRFLRIVALGNGR